MQSIVEWLEELGLGHYVQRFAENGVDFSVLRHLTDQDLKDIGILLGHRRKMLAAIAELAGAVPAPLQAAAAIEPKPHDAAHRDVQRPRGLDCLIGQTRSRGLAGDHQHLSPLLHGVGRAEWWLRRKVHG